MVIRVPSSIIANSCVDVIRTNGGEDGVVPVGSSLSSSPSAFD